MTKFCEYIDGFKVSPQDCLEGKGFDPHDKFESFRKSKAVELNVEQLANFNLWVAAPELYEWLEFILRDEAMVHYFSLTYPEAFKGAKAALSKALGEKT